MKIGYARVSRSEQCLDLQLDALKKVGCDRVFTDKLSGALDERPGLLEAMEFAREGDTICVWRLDRLGRSMTHLLKSIAVLKTRGVQFVSLTESLDTSTPTGRLMFHVISALCEFEKDLLRTRTNAGLTAARERGRIGGRPRAMDAGKLALAKAMIATSRSSAQDVCTSLGISRSTLFRSLKEDSQ